MSSDRTGGDVLAILGAAAVGALVGAAAALMLAPKKGSELREEISKGAQAAADRLQTAVEQLSEQVGAFHAKVSDHGRTAGEDAVAVEVEGPDAAEADAKPTTDTDDA